MDTPPAIDPRLSARFAGDLAALGFADGTLGIAVSGGPDSLALLLLAHATLPGRIATATVDHGLRPESAAEAAMVAGVCAALGVPHATLRVTVSPGNLQDRARAARYEALAGWMTAQGLDALATAHHADDQAETLLMRLNRGSGLAGLAGVRAGGQVPGSAHALLRPLLGWRRAELAAVVAPAGLTPAEDPSNADPRFDRARLRRFLSSDSENTLDIAAIAQSCAHLADAHEALEWAVEREWHEAVRMAADGAGLVYRPQAPHAIRLRVVERAITQLGGAPPRGGAVHRLCETLARGGKATLGGVVARRAGDAWSFQAEPPRRHPGPQSEPGA